MSLPLQHVREAVLDALIVQLQRIGTDDTIVWASSKFVTVKKLQQDAFSLNAFPHVLVVPRGESKRRDAAGGSKSRYASTMDILLDCWLETWDMSVEISRFLHDVEMILGLDYTLLGTAVNLRVTGNRTSLSEDAQPLCGIQVYLEVDYRYWEDVPSVPV